MPDPAAPTDDAADGAAGGLTREAAGDEYVVVARRYRPQTFDELIGQQHVAEALTQAIRSGRIGHAYLFTGARGVGKTSAARIFAKALNCESGPTPTPCNACDACQRIATGDDVDVLEIDGASNRGVDEIRQLRQNAGVRPSRGRFKVYLIDEVHMLTKEAFNALLKTLEEPPEHVKFLFATTEPQKIPITILSRCQRFDFAGVDAESIGHRLAQIAEAEGVGIDEEAVQVLAVRAAGSMRDSQSLLEQLLAVSDERITADDVYRLLGIAPAARVAELAERLADRDASAALAIVEASVRSGADPGQVLDQLMGYFRDVMAVAVGCPPQQMLYALPAQHEAARAVGERLGVNTLLAAMQVLDQAAARMRVSVHQRILADMAVVRIASLEDLDDLSQAVADLRAGVAPATPSSRTAPPPATTNRPTVKKNADAPAAAPPSMPPSMPPPESEPPTKASEPPAVGGSLTEALRAAAPPKPAPVPPPPANGSPSAKSSPTQTDDRREDANQSGPARVESNGVSGNESATDGAESLVAKMNASLAGGPATPAARPAPRPNRRQQQAEIAKHPYVAKAMEVFGVEQEGIRYLPPRREGS